MNVGIYLYNQAEVLDFSGPFEVFTTATRVCAESPDKPFRTFLISQTGDVVTARAGYQVIPSCGFKDAPDVLDVLIVVGGVHTDEMKKEAVLSWIAEKAKYAKVTASVCTGAFLLAASKVITKQQVTTHWEDIPDLRSQFPDLTVVENQRWVDDDSCADSKIVTSGGISAGIDMSLYLVSKLHSLELAKKTARQMEFDWNPPPE